MHDSEFLRQFLHNVLNERGLDETLSDTRVAPGAWGAWSCECPETYSDFVEQ
jgi:hypothetical protein